MVASSSAILSLSQLGTSLSGTRKFFSHDIRRNAIIGKALESHDNGTGKIVVLISLQ